MKRSLLLLALSLGALACASKTPPPASTPVTQPAAPAPSAQATAAAFLKDYFADFAKLEHAMALGWWTAANSGKKEDFDAYAAADLALKTMHSDPKRYAKIEELLASRAELAPLTVRSLELAKLAFKGNQLSKELLEKMVNESAAIEQIFKTYRPEVGGKRLTDNDLVRVLREEKNVAQRQAAWEASKKVGAEVAPRLVALAGVRNEAAKSLGFKDYWDMQVRLQEHDPDQLVALFAELERLTDEPFRKMKATLDEETARRFKTKPGALMPWHYTNPFFQAAPPSEKVDPNTFYASKKKEDIVEIARRFYADIGIDIAPIAERSDLYEREGKDQHAYCVSIDRDQDVRTLLNVAPSERWMETMLHEMGHAVYYRGIDRTLPFNLRDPAHIFTTEAVAMLFGALAQNPLWLTTYAGVDAAKVKALEPAILEQRRREQLIFVRWGLVMFHFERALYANPQQDLDTLWYDLVERYQLLKRPVGRKAADWAAKPHFTSAPVYYHNYVLGELYASQLREKLSALAGHQGPASALSFNGRKDFGSYLTEKVFLPGARTAWPRFVEESTGKPLGAEAFAKEL